MSCLNILIVEDEWETMKFIKNCLQRELECEIYESVNGMNAIEKMRALDLDLVILDLKMPGISGLDVMREIKKERTLPDILVVTAWDSDQVEQVVVEEGALGYMPKPFVPETLILKVKSILERKGKYKKKDLAIGE